MNKRNLFILIVAVVAVVLLVFLGGDFKKKKEMPVDVFRPDNPDVAAAGNAVSVPESAAAPANVSESSGSRTSVTLRDFEIKAEKGKFMPSKVVVNDGDVMTVRFTAIDADYNIFFPDFGVYAVASKGQTVKRQFQATPYGQYEFFCKDCSNDTQGTLIVNQR